MFVSGQTVHLTFVFSGQGPQWWAMGRQLLEEEPVFRDVINRCDELIAKLGSSWSLLRELSAEESDSRIGETAIAQPAIFAIQAALAALWQSWGVTPNAVVGHSVGEVAAAYVAGRLTLRTPLPSSTTAGAAWIRPRAGGCSPSRCRWKRRPH